MFLRESVCISQRWLSILVSFVLRTEAENEEERRSVGAAPSHHRRPPLEPLNETSRIQPAVPTVFLDQMLENHSTGGMVRDKSALLRVSCQTQNQPHVFRTANQMPYPGSRP